LPITNIAHANTLIVRDRFEHPVVQGDKEFHFNQIHLLGNRYSEFVQQNGTIGSWLPAPIQNQPYLLKKFTEQGGATVSGLLQTLYN
jgi:hypothetical protein